MIASGHKTFRTIWWSCNLLLMAAILAVGFAGAREFSVRRYLRGFSDAIVPVDATPEQKTEAIIGWMRSGPARPVAAKPSELSTRDPENTLNYRQLLSFCGSATNAFLNLSEIAGLRARRLLLLGPDNQAKHVVAEVWIDGLWIVVDPAFRLIMRDGNGRLLTLRDVQNPGVLSQATSHTPDYPADYAFNHVAHVRVPRLPLIGSRIPRALNALLPGWDESLDWNLLLERESFLLLTFSTIALVLLLVLRAALAWYADHRLQIPRFRFREHVRRAGVAFFSTPGIK